MKNDFLMIYLLEHKKSRNILDKIKLWWLKRDNPSYKEDQFLVNDLKKRGYISDVNQLETELARSLEICLATLRTASSTSSLPPLLLEIGRSPVSIK
ncbi:hypothetical protein [Chryseobacterium lathyri]|uniref:hypothetical protein n=1 Tax=Chryseobacterium lathyri TaxID=395933 RepID=UPI001CC0BBD1|nr:hypothetical protein [Chryseobacterium lathyri]